MRIRSGRSRLVAALAAFIMMAACGSATAPNGATASIDGAWTGSTSVYSAIHLDLAERMVDHALTGHWNSARVGCTHGTCVDSGIVYYGTRTGDQMHFGLTALNGSRSLAIDATFDGRQMKRHLAAHGSGRAFAERVDQAAAAIDGCGDEADRIHCAPYTLALRRFV